MIRSTVKWIDGEYCGTELIEDGEYVWVWQQSGDYLSFRKMVIQDWEQHLFSCPISKFLFCYNKDKRCLEKL